MNKYNETYKRIRILSKSADLDERYGPWNSITEANNNVPIGVREPGLTVGIYIEPNLIKEYWYNGGTMSSNLVPKNEGNELILLQEDIVAEFGLGGIEEGETIPSGTSFTQFVEQILTGDNFSDNTVLYINEDTPPITIGGFIEGQSATPEQGLTFQEAFDKLLFPAVEPTVNLSISGQPEFKEPDFTNTLNWNITINSTGASIDSLSLEFRRNDSGNWTQLEDDITATSFGHIISGNTSNNTWNYRLIITDTQGATTTATINRDMKAYEAPTINFNLSSSQLNYFERGESISVTGGTVSQESPFVNISNYVLEQQLNGGSWIEVDSSNLNSNGGNINSYTFNNEENTETIRFRVIVTDSEGTTTSNSSIITFRKASYFGWSTLISWESSLINESNISKYLLTSRSNTFNNINPGQGEYTYYIYPVSYGDLEEAIQDGAAPVLGSFTKIENSVSISNSYGVFIDYMVYKSNADDAFSGNSVNFS